MVGATLGPLQIHTKGDSIYAKVTITREVPKWFPASPVYFNMYIDDLTTEEDEWNGSRKDR